MALGVEMVQKTDDFKKALLKWFELDNNLKTWMRFKRHFTDAHKELKNVRGRTIKNTSYYQAKAIVEEVTQNKDKLKSDILNSMTILHSQQSQTDSRSISPHTVPMQASSVTHSMNNATNNDLLQLIKQLQQQLQAPKATKKKKRFVTHYCRTHGACGHPSHLCRNKKEEHQDDTTF